MPSSDYRSIPLVLSNALRIQPKSVLDIGSGFGKYGLLLREYLEGWKDRVFPEQWQVRIDAVEIFEPYTKRLPWYPAVYSNVYRMSLAEFVARGELAYDLVLMGDVIEHMPKQEAVSTVGKVVQAAKRAVIVAVPLGEGWLGNVVVAGNDAEKHRSSWGKGEILSLFPAGWRLAEELSMGARRGPILSLCMER